MTKEELIVEERKMAILHEACRGHRTIAEAICLVQQLAQAWKEMERRR